MFKNFFLLVIVTISNTTFSMEKPPKSLAVFVIPCQNKIGCEPEYIQRVLKRDLLEIIPVETPTYIHDLGQNRCIGYLKKALEQSSGNKRAIIYANSQGTATALNFMGDATNQTGKIDGLVLEGALASGNSAIIHTAKNLMHLERVTNLPFSNYWIPYVAKGLFPAYWPGGKQPIKSIDHIRTDIPIIIVHSKKDPQLAYDDACALYYGLCAKGNNNVYLISCPGQAHINIFTDNPRIAVSEILARYGLLESQTKIDLTRYQPDYKQFKVQYDSLLTTEKKHEFLKYTLGAGLACLAAYKMGQSRIPRFLTDIALRKFAQKSPLTSQ